MAVIDEVLEQLRQRREQLDETITAVLGERARVAAAIAAATAGVGSATSNDRRSTRARGPSPRSGVSRAPRGHNQQLVLEVTAKDAKRFSEIVQLTEIKRETLSVTLSTMVKKGLLTKGPDGRYKAAISTNSRRKPAERKLAPRGARQRATAARSPAPRH
jgi:hypothetical protein